MRTPTLPDRSSLSSRSRFRRDAAACLDTDPALEIKRPSCKTLTPTPEPAGYCAGDVAGERGDRATQSSTRLQRGATSTPSGASWTQTSSGLPHGWLEGGEPIAATTESGAGGETSSTAWEIFDVEVDGDARRRRPVARPVRFAGSGAGSGVADREHDWRVARHDARRKDRRWRSFDDRAEALEAAGLSE